MKRPGLIICTAAFLAVFIAAEIVFATLGGMMSSQKAAARWSGGGETYAQLTLYRAIGEEMGYSDIYSLRTKIQSALTQGSIDQSWSDSYNVKTKTQAAGDHASTSADTYAFGGNFFLFHPFKLVDGQYIYDSDLSRDRVVITRTLAWKIFGATNVAGMTMTVNGGTYIVAGVVDDEDDIFDKAAGGVGESVFMFYDQLFSYEASNISCYEMALPEPVNGYAMNMVKNLSTGTFIQNSKRFTAERIFKIIGDFGERSMNTSGMVFPYWENAARCCEDWLALVLCIAVASAILPIFYACAWAVIAFKALRRGVGKRIAAHKMR